MALGVCGVVWVFGHGDGCCVGKSMVCEVWSGWLCGLDERELIWKKHLWGLGFWVWGVWKRRGFL